MPDQFSDRLLGMLPRLRVHALALTHDRAAADDLVQDAVVNALEKRDSVKPDTDVTAWMHALLRDCFLTVSREQREIAGLIGAPEVSLSITDGQESHLLLGELERGMGHLPPKMREALVMFAVLGMPHEAIAAATETALGTVRTRVFWARKRLWALLSGEADAGRPGSSVLVLGCGASVATG